MVSSTNQRDAADEQSSRKFDCALAQHFIGNSSILSLPVQNNQQGASHTKVVWFDQFLPNTCERNFANVSVEKECVLFHALAMRVALTGTNSTFQD